MTVCWGWWHLLHIYTESVVSWWAAAVLIIIPISLNVSLHYLLLTLAAPTDIHTGGYNRIVLVWVLTPVWMVYTVDGVPEGLAWSQPSTDSACDLESRALRALSHTGLYGHIAGESELLWDVAFIKTTSDISLEFGIYYYQEDSVRNCTTNTHIQRR